MPKHERARGDPTLTRKTKSSSPDRHLHPMEAGGSDNPTASAAFRPWSSSVDDCLREYRTTLHRGLSASEVEARRRRHGWNELPSALRRPLWRLMLRQFDDVLVKLLLLASLISLAAACLQEREPTGEPYLEPLVILAFLSLNAAVGAWQESRAEKALEALGELQCPHARVLRDGRYAPFTPSRELVPGDIVELRAGDRVPADLRIAVLKTLSLRVEQSSLTGESMPAGKDAAPVEVADCELQRKRCMLFAGTAIASGGCVAIVAGVGGATEIGRIQRQIQEAAASVESEGTPLTRKLDGFARVLGAAIGLICLVVWGISYRNYLTWEPDAASFLDFRFNLEKCTYYLKIAVALAVAAIPEGLPAVITTCLSLGARRLAWRNAIVRKLASVETLGCTTVICSDKTGTLTTNQMAVQEFLTFGMDVADFRSFRVAGTTYDPRDGGIKGWSCREMDCSNFALAEICAICNDAGISRDGHAVKATGLPTEAALKVLVEKMGVPDVEARNRIRDLRLSDFYLLNQRSDKLGCCDWWLKRARRIAALEFDRIRKSMGVIVCEPNGSNRLLVKGAVESVLARSSSVQVADGSIAPMDETARQLILLRLHEMSGMGLRCLGLAFKDDLGELADYSSEIHPSHNMLIDPSNYLSIESHLVFVGIVGLKDPPREGVWKAIQDCRGAGIKVIVITGDNKSTADAICCEIGLFHDDCDIKGRSFACKEFMALSIEEQVNILSRPGGNVFSRAEPKHKQDIVRLLKNRGEIVAMTGDGVNDAPALKLADIGIAMGVTGTEVAKEASDMVLVDDNFNTIVSAIEEGRSIYSNMKAFIRYLISSNIGEVFSVFLTAMLGIPECLISVHLLWVNLVTDGPPATALGFNPPDPDIMQKPPRKSNDALISSWVLFRYLVISAYVGAATVGVFVLWYTQPSFMGIDLVRDGHTLVTLSQLQSWGECPTWTDFHPTPFTAGARVLDFPDPCDYFVTGKVKATTLSLSVLVALEMFNSLNALSEENSLLKTPPWANPWLLFAMLFSLGLHAVVLYIPFLARMFGVAPLGLEEWFLVFMVSAPVVLIDEVLKLLGRWRGRECKSKTE